MRLNRHANGRAVESQFRAAQESETLRSRKLASLECLFYKQVPRRLLAETQFPDIVDGPDGPIRKPNGW